MRINKLLAKLGICSRRQADQYIQDGRVYINNIKALYYMNVDEASIVTLDGKQLPSLKFHQDILYIFHKPKYVLTSTKDHLHRVTLKKFFHQEHLMPIGRLDYQSEGLLLLTNNGELARTFELPKNRIQRVYMVDVIGTPLQSWLSRIRKGITTTNKQHQVIHYHPANVTIIKKQLPNRYTLEFQLYEGKNREIRNMCHSAGLNVIRLSRQQYGPFKLHALPVGQMEKTDIQQCFTWLSEHLKVAN